MCGARIVRVTFKNHPECVDGPLLASDSFVRYSNESNVCLDGLQPISATVLASTASFSQPQTKNTKIGGACQQLFSGGQTYFAPALRGLTRIIEDNRNPVSVNSPVKAHQVVCSVDVPSTVYRAEVAKPVLVSKTFHEV